METLSPAVLAMVTEGGVISFITSMVSETLEDVWVTVIVKVPSDKRL